MNFSKNNYQEDIEIHIKKPEDFYNEIFPVVKDNYLKNISENKTNDIKEKIKMICQNEYEKVIKNNNLPIWKNIKSNIISSVNQAIEAYIDKIFNGKKCRDEIDPNLAKKYEIMNIIPSNIKYNSLIKNEKKMKF